MNVPIPKLKWIFCIRKKEGPSLFRSFWLSINLINLDLLYPSILLTYICEEMDIFALSIENFFFSWYFSLKAEKIKVCWPLDMRRSIVFAMLVYSSYVCQQRVGPYFGLSKSTSIQMSNLSKQLGAVHKLRLQEEEGK